MNNGGRFDKRFHILDVMEKYQWTFEQYLNRPLWFDPIYEIKIKAEATAQKKKNKANE